MNRIRDLREDRDLRQIDVSKGTGIDQKTLSNYETGKTNPDSYSIIKLAEFFQVSTDYLLGYSTISIKNHQNVINRLERIEQELSEIKKAIQNS
ncbi:MAG: helix-turn-helix transcriptional regulator [Ruminococcaceae bacterium]|nr:helix-turn-helix transcriptional regulator [Oscillospiraceae bacterium]